MIIRKEISDAQARDAIRNGEFGTEIITSAPFVAVVLSQSWCTEWRLMQRWLDSKHKKGALAEMEIAVCEFIYDKSEIEDEFIAFKENTLGNDQIPYVRYYRDGQYLGDSNYQSPTVFATRFQPS